MLVTPVLARMVATVKQLDMIRIGVTASMVMEDITVTQVMNLMKLFVDLIMQFL